MFIVSSSDININCNHISDCFFRSWDYGATEGMKCHDWIHRKTIPSGKQKEVNYINVIVFLFLKLYKCFVLFFYNAIDTYCLIHLIYFIAHGNVST